MLQLLFFLILQSDRVLGSKQMFFNGWFESAYELQFLCFRDMISCHEDEKRERKQKKHGIERILVALTVQTVQATPL